MVAAAFFDVDRTILDGSSLLALVRPMRHEGLLSLPTVVRAAGRQLWFSLRGYSDLQIDSAAVAAATAVTGMDAAALRQFGVTAIPRVLLPRVFLEAKAEIAAHRAAGRKVYLVSSAPAEIIEDLGRLLGADGVAATRSEIDATGHYTGTIVRFCHGQGKADAVQEIAAREGIDLGASFAYGDSTSDLPMLLSVGHPVPVNPDSRLRAVAQMRGWDVRRFSHRSGGAVRLSAVVAARPPRRPGPDSGADGVG